MTRFENKICPVCRAPFQGEADIVVCPICGTPHHRVCYSVNQRCALEELHDKGFVWNGRLPDEPEPAAEKTQPDEGADPHHAEYPAAAPVNNEAQMLEEFDIDGQVRDFFNGMNDKTIGEDGVSMHELAAYSATSIYHYGRAFSAFRGTADGKKHKVFFNICSGFFAPVFQFYRKMDFLGLLVLLFNAALLLLIRTLSSAAGISADYSMYLYNFINIGEIALLCIFGDYIYYRHAVRQIIKIRAEFKSGTQTDEYYMELYERGKPSFLRALIGCLAMAFAEACVMTLPAILG